MGSSKALPESRFPLAAGERLLSVVHEGKVENTVLFSGVLFRAAMDAASRAARSCGRTDEALGAVVFSAASVEAFVNELAHVADAIGGATKDSQLLTLADVLETAEENHQQIRPKIALARWVLAGKHYPRGESLWQDFALLIDLRNLLVHAKPHRTFDQPKKIDSLKAALQSRGLVDSDAQGAILGVVLNARIARFACNSASAIIRDLDAQRPLGGCDGVALLTCAREAPPPNSTHLDSLFPLIK